MRPITHRKVVDRLAVSAAGRFRLSPLELWSRSQDRRIVEARREVMAALAGEGWSQAEIAAAFGMDRSTVAYHLAVEAERPAREPAAPRRCAVAGCDRPRHARGWCGRHYSRWRYHGDPTGGGPEVRVLARLDPAPLADAIARSGRSVTLLSDSDRRAWHEAVAAGRVSDLVADRVAVRVLGRTLDEIYGPDWDQAA